MIMQTETNFDHWKFQEDVQLFYMDALKSELSKKGYYGIDIYYQLDGQGSGACIEARINPNEFIKAHGLYNEFRSTYVSHCCNFEIKSKNSHYCHAETMKIHDRGKYMYDHGYFVTENCLNELPEFLDYVLQQSKDYANQFYNDIREEYHNRL
jgi:hypothetical protein